MNSFQIALFSVFLACSLQPVFGQADQTIEIEEIYAISQYGIVEACTLYIPIADHYNRRQEVKKIYFSVKPSYYTILDDSKYAVFEFEAMDLNTIRSLTIRTEVELYDYDLTVIQLEKNFEVSDNDKTRKYLKTNGIYKLKKDKIQPELLSAFDDRLTKVSDIHEFVVNHMNYQNLLGDDISAQNAYDTQVGDCTEYADLMVALCRYNAIPARRVSGIAVERNNDDIMTKPSGTVGHAWVEVYIDEYGWVPFDPTHSDGHRITTFSNLQPKYIYTQFSEQAKKYYWEYLGYGSIDVALTRKVAAIADVSKK